MTWRSSFFLLFIWTSASHGAGPGPDQLSVVSGDNPRVFFFRTSEGLAVRPSMKYEAWEGTFSRLMGIEGKVLAEEIHRETARQQDFFSRFKAAHPTEMVLLHYNGDARLPDDARQFFAGHWLYFNGVTAEGGLSATETESDLEVSDRHLFKTETGRNKNSNEDIGLCELDAQGRPDWSRSEQAKIMSIKPLQGKKGVLHLRRAQFGTAARAFPAGKTYAAAHLSTGPWSNDPQLLWMYNFSTTCPRDSQGRTCADLHVEELVQALQPGGPLEKFDGVEFDVARNAIGKEGVATGRMADADADGVGDSGYVNGRNVYGEGSHAFCQELRRRLGPTRLILADGWDPTMVRAFDSLNGDESEGWPRLGDAKLAEWSGGLNRAAFWNAHAVAPHFNYVNHKFKEGERMNSPGPAYNRLVFAAACFMDYAICSSLAAPVEKGEYYGIWDEFWAGTEKRVGWLGQPKGAALHLGYATPDLLGGTGAPASEALVAKLAGAEAEMKLNGPAVRIRGKDAKQAKTTVSLQLPAGTGGDVLLHFTVRAEPGAQWGVGQPRALRVSMDEDGRGHGGTWVSAEPIEYSFFATDLAVDKPVTIYFEIEGSEPWEISALTVHASADAMTREYDHGLVLANPSAKPFEFDLAKLFPGEKFRRLQGSASQDPVANNGQPAGGKVVLAPRDGLFLLKE